MKAIIKERPEQGKEWETGLRFVEKPIPTLQKDTDVKLQIIASAICGTDLGIYNSKESLRDPMSVAMKPDVIIGHEFCSTLSEAGAAARVHLAALLITEARGDRVIQRFIKGRSAKGLAKDTHFLEFLSEHFYSTAEMHVTCGKCYQCRTGQRHICSNTIIRGIQDDGAFTRYIVLPAENIRIFKKGDIPPDVIAFMDAIGNATHTVQSANVRGKTIAITGLGVQGLMATAIAKSAGAKKIFVTDASHGEFTYEKLANGRFRLARLYGADDCFDVHIDNDKDRFYKTVKKATNGVGVDAVLEMSGNYKAYDDAFRVLRMGGCMSLLGLPGGMMVVDFSKDVIFKGVTIHGVIGRRVWETWDMMTHILRKGLAKTFIETGFITHDLLLEKYEEGFQAIMNGDALKVILRP
ncbi:MAG: zinc-binding dehydrogenase [Bacteroidota bacterium]